MKTEFDTLFNNITSNQSPGLNEYEISVFLTKGQEEIVKNAFNPKGNKYQEGYDGSAKRQADFAHLLTTDTLDTATVTTKFDSRSKTYLFPSDLFIVINEQVVETKESGDTTIFNVTPISVGEYKRLVSGPYKYPLKRQVWRLITNSGTQDRPIVEIIGKFSSSTPTLEYVMNYIRIPNPIILSDLTSEGLYIRGQQAVTTELDIPEHLCGEVVQRAVELAKVAWQGDIQTVTQAGQRSE